MKNVMIIGATSAIAEATARRFAHRNDRLFLMARNRDRLKSVSKDLLIRGATAAQYGAFDANGFEDHQSVIDTAFQTLKEVDIVLVAHGTLPDQKACEKDAGLSVKEISTNALSTISILTHISNRMEKAGHGTIAVITSVAGERGRQSNYVYGCAKGMTGIFLQGLRNRLYRSNIHVMDIRPGFVDTPMTEKFKKGILWARPDKIADCIVKGIDKKKGTVYAPSFWRFIMLIIKFIPERIFIRLKL